MIRLKSTEIPFLPYVINIEELQDVADPYEMGFDSISDAFNDEVFRHIRKGLERICILLRADGLTYREIAWVTGQKKDRVEAAVARVRQRMIALKNNKTQNI
jgi:DNA-directed RNA polymerase specialized sigma24 family protein